MNRWSPAAWLRTAVRYGGWYYALTVVLLATGAGFLLLQGEPSLSFGQRIVGVTFALAFAAFAAFVPFRAALRRTFAARRVVVHEGRAPEQGPVVAFSGVVAVLNDLLPDIAVEAGAAPPGFLGWTRDSWFEDPPLRVGQAEVRALLERRFPASADVVDGASGYASLCRMGQVTVPGSDGRDWTLRREVGNYTRRPEPHVVDDRGDYLCVAVTPMQAVAWEDAWLGMLRWIFTDAARLRGIANNRGPAAPFAPRPVIVASGQMAVHAAAVAGSTVLRPLARLDQRNINQYEATCQADAVRRLMALGFYATDIVVRSLTARDCGRDNWEFAAHTQEWDWGLAGSQALVIWGLSVDPRLPGRFDHVEISLGQGGATRLALADPHALYLPTRFEVPVPDSDAARERDPQRMATIYHFSPTGYFDLPLVFRPNEWVHVQLHRSSADGTVRVREPALLALEGIVVEGDGHTVAVRR